MFFPHGFLPLYYLILTVSSTYNSFRWHFRENFDPSEADPKRNLSCVGDSYDLKLPLLNGFNPNGLSMQKLCAKPQYGGGERYQHAGAYCYYPKDQEDSELQDNKSSSDYEDFFPDDRSSDDTDYEPSLTGQWMLRGKIIFDNHPGAETSRQLQNPRVLQACLYRCFCNYGIEDVSIQPQSDHLPVSLWPAIDGYQLQIDVNNDFTVPYTLKRGHIPLDGFDTPLYKKPQIDRRDLGWIARPTYMNLDPGNEIECTGNLPTFALPSPYTRDTFDSVQELCAVALSGGNKDVNAGGYCHRSARSSSTLFTAENTVWFSDSMTPRHDWTWGGGSFYATASIRFHCWRQCACKNNPPRDPDTTKLWHFITSLQLRLQDDGSVNLEPSGTPPQMQQQQQQQQQGQGSSQGQGTRTSGSTQQQILPPQPPGAKDSPSGTCGPSHNEFCPKTWDVAAWGPIPQEPPNVTDIVSPSPPEPGTMGVCGNRCTGPQDCGTTDEQYICSCAFPSDSDARVLGLDPVAPVAVCIALLAAKVGGQGGTGSLGGRNVGIRGV